MPRRVSGGATVKHGAGYGGATCGGGQYGVLTISTSFERCLVAPVAFRPDDVLEGVLVRFMSNLKPATRNIKCVASCSIEMYG
jgi:hypothetical protein